MNIPKHLIIKDNGDIDITLSFTIGVECGMQNTAVLMVAARARKKMFERRRQLCWSQVIFGFVVMATLGLVVWTIEEFDGLDILVISAAPFLVLGFILIDTINSLRRFRTNPVAFASDEKIEGIHYARDKTPSALPRSGNAVLDDASGFPILRDALWGLYELRQTSVYGNNSQLAEALTDTYLELFGEVCACLKAIDTAVQAERLATRHVASNDLPAGVMQSFMEAAQYQLMQRQTEMATLTLRLNAYAKTYGDAVSAAISNQSSAQQEANSRQAAAEAWANFEALQHLMR